jgi:predicted small integral membrane protein
LHGPAATFNRAKTLAIAALTLGMLMWLVAFVTVGGEWFLMWQSRQWNGQDAAFPACSPSSALCFCWLRSQNPKASPSSLL